MAPLLVSVPTVALNVPFSESATLAVGVMPFKSSDASVATVAAAAAVPSAPLAPTFNVPALIATVPVRPLVAIRSSGCETI